MKSAIHSVIFTRYIKQVTVVRSIDREREPFVKVRTRTKCILFAGRKYCYRSRCALSFLRRLRVEVGGVQGTPPCIRTYITTPSLFFS